MQIEQLISYQIQNQFPAVYKEYGPELIGLMTQYYVFLEQQTNQSTYNNRRLFDFGDVDTTLVSLLSFYKNTFFSDLPLVTNTDSLRFTIKHILDLYRRRGSEEGLHLLFKMFFDKQISVYYPSQDILKPSDSAWKQEQFIQLYPIDITTLKGLVGQNIIGSISNATATVDNITFITINSTVVPIIKIEYISGVFTKEDDILSSYTGSVVKYGRVYGSIDAVTIQPSTNDTIGNNVGDVVTIQSANGVGAQGVVSNVSTTFTGQISYTVVDGGFGYTIDNTVLLVSNQVLILENNSLQFKPLDILVDQFGNKGIVTGQNEVSVGVRMDANSAFTANSIIRIGIPAGPVITNVSDGVDSIDYTITGTTPIQTTGITNISLKNDSSPGIPYPFATSIEKPTAVQVSALSDIQSVSIIRDIIGNFSNVAINSVNYNAVPPALVPMSGTANTVNANTALNVAFNTAPISVGSIVSFKNVNPGNDYVNDVFALAYDPVIASLGKRDQIVQLDTFSTSFTVGSYITQGTVRAKIKQVLPQVNSLVITPYTYSGFTSGPILFNSASFNIVSATYYNSTEVLGDNANISSTTEFKVGKILSVDITDTGYGYVDGETANIVNANNVVAAVATLSVKGQGKKKGSWITYNSHINSSYNKPIQDSDFYQIYSYVIKSELDPSSYTDYVKKIAHVAGTKMFSEFVYQDITPSNISGTDVIARALLTAPALALKDRPGAYILDRPENFIETRV